MSLKTGKPMDSEAKRRPRAGRPKRSPAKTGLMFVGLLTVVVTMVKMARRRTG
jgi:hypothetical protein